ncbi:MAG: hypothetical protein ABEK04_05615 [Candidatus Nanohalobium sp.]
MSEPVTREDVLGAAIELVEPTFMYVVALGGYYLIKHMVITEGLLQEPYVNEIMVLAMLSLAFLTAILIFAWGFVAYLALEYLATGGKKDE